MAQQSKAGGRPLEQRWCPARAGLPGCGTETQRELKQPQETREQLELGHPRGTPQAHPRETARSWQICSTPTFHGTGAGGHPGLPVPCRARAGSRPQVLTSRRKVEKSPPVSRGGLKPGAVSSHPCDPRLSDGDAAPVLRQHALRQGGHLHLSHPRADGGSSEAAHPESRAAGRRTPGRDPHATLPHPRGKLILTLQAPGTICKHQGGRNERLPQSSPLPQRDRGAGSPAAPADGRGATASRSAPLSPIIRLGRGHRVTPRLPTDKHGLAFQEPL